MATSLRQNVRTASTWSIVLSVAMIVTALLAMAIPGATGLAVTLVFGWLLIINSGLHLGFAVRANRPRAVAWEILIAALYAGVGYYLVSRPLLGLEALTFALAVYLVGEGVLEFALAFVLRVLPGSGWLVFDGVLTLLLAVMIWSGWPVSSIWAVGTIAAVSMLFSGLTRLMLSVAIRQVAA